MKRITLGKLFSFYVDIFNRFGLHLLSETDQMLGYYVFEATGIEIGYCSNQILTQFLDEGMIDQEIFENSSFLLESFRRLENTMPIRNAESIRNSPEWKKLMELSDNIKKMIKTKWTDEELQAIYGFDQPVNLNTGCD